tara:strand:+ start:81 stop:470 length:390 start_codon:yes stop_codon:yes gene_type:complete
MFSKYNDNVAAIALGLFLLGIASYVFQLFFTTEAWLLANEINVNATLIARVMGGAWLGLGVGLFLTFLNGPDGQKIYFWTLGVAQIATLLVLLYHYLALKTPGTADDAAIVSVLTLLFLIGFFKIKSRL